MERAYDLALLLDFVENPRNDWRNAAGDLAKAIDTALEAIDALDADLLALVRYHKARLQMEHPSALYEDEERQELAEAKAALSDRVKRMLEDSDGNKT